MSVLYSVLPVCSHEQQQTISRSELDSDESLLVALAQLSSVEQELATNSDLQLTETNLQVHTVPSSVESLILDLPQESSNCTQPSLLQDSLMQVSAVKDKPIEVIEPLAAVKSVDSLDAFKVIEDIGGVGTVGSNVQDASTIPPQDAFVKHVFDQKIKMDCNLIGYGAGNVGNACNVSSGLSACTVSNTGTVDTKVNEGKDENTGNAENTGNTGVLANACVSGSDRVLSNVCTTGNLESGCLKGIEQPAIAEEHNCVHAFTKVAGVGSCKPVHRLVIRNFSKLSDEALTYVLYYRNLKAVRLNMVTTDEITKESHLNFCRALAQHSDRLYLLSSFDGRPMSVASIHATADWSRILDYGMYAVGTLHPECNACDEGRIPVHAIDQLVISHLVLIRGILAVDFKFKPSNHKSLHVNLNKLRTTVISQNADFVHTRLDCSQAATLCQKYLHDFCIKYNCTIEFDL